MRYAIPVAIALILLAYGLRWVNADQQQASGYDVDGNGVVNSADLLQVALKFGEETGANPCVSYETFDENNQPDYLIVNSLGAVVTPMGGYFLLPGDHPAREGFRLGTPVPPRLCLND